MKKLLCILVVFSFRIYSQNADSLVQLLNASKNEDTVRLNLLFAIIESTDDESVWPKYNEMAFLLSQKLSKSTNGAISRKGHLGMSITLFDKGILCFEKGEVTKATNYYEQGLKESLEINDKLGQAKAYNNLGAIYKNQGDIKKAFDYLGKSLKIVEGLGMKNETAILLNNLGAFYKNQYDNEHALEYYTRSLKIREEIKDKKGMAESLTNLGKLYFDLNNKEKALDVWNRALKFAEEVNSQRILGHLYYFIGTVYQSKGDIPTTLSYFHRSVDIRRAIADKDGYSISLSRIGRLHLSMSANSKSKLERQKNLALARAYADTGLVVSKELGYPANILDAELVLARLDSVEGNFLNAYNHYKQFVFYKDSVINEDTRKASTRSQLNYEYEKKEAVIKEQQAKEQAVAEEKSRFQKIVIGVVLFGLILVIVFAISIARNLKQTRIQKLIIEEKQKDILDSIHYAKRIQTALITPESIIEKHLNRLQK